MTNLDITIRVANDGYYSASCNDCPALFGGGKTPDAAIEELKETLRLVKEDGRETALFYPDWLDDDYTFQVHWDVETMLRHYSGIITPTALGKMSGIHPKQLICTASQNPGRHRSSRLRRPSTSWGNNY